MNKKDELLSKWLTVERVFSIIGIIGSGYSLMTLFRETQIKGFINLPWLLIIVFILTIWRYTVITNLSKHLNYYE
jgi:hypothetical protein